MATKYPSCTQYSLSQIRCFCANAKGRVGEQGWRYLSHGMRQALVAEEVMKVMFANARLDSGEGVKIGWFRELYRAMMVEIGLAETEEV